MNVRTTILTAGGTMLAVVLWVALAAMTGGEALAQPGCDISWNAPGGGSWSEAANWSSGQVPTASDRVCITLGGNYQVTVDSDVTVADLTIETASGTPTLIVATSEFTVSGTLANSENLRLTYPAAQGGGVPVRLSGGSVVNRGLITVISGYYPARLNVNLTNETGGTLRLEQAGLAFERPAGELVNRGTIAINPSNTLSISGSDKTFTQAGGSLIIDGAFTVNGATYNFDGGGIIANGPQLTDARLVISPGSTATGTLHLFNATSISGNLLPGQTLDFDSTYDITIEGDLSNRGTINFATGRLTINNGTLSNAQGGTMQMREGNTIRVNGNFVNQGQLIIKGSLSFERSSATYSNSGTISIDPNGYLSFTGSQPTFTQAGGVLTNNGTVVLGNGTFRFLGGSLGGAELTLTSCLLELGASSGAGKFSLGGASSTLSGDIHPGQTIVLNGTTLGVDGGFTNAGTLRTTSYASLVLRDGVFTNAAGATFDVQTNIRITGAFINQGTLRLRGSLNYDTPGGAFLNVGTIAIESGHTLSIDRGTFTNRGSLNGIAGTLWVGGQGTLAGGGSLAVNVTNYGMISPGGSGYGQILIGGDLSSVGPLELQIGGAEAGGTMDQLAVLGSANIGGPLNAEFAGGFIPEVGAQFPLLTYGTNNGVNISPANFQTDGMLRVEGSAGDSAYTVTVTQVLGSAGPPWLVMLYLAGDDIPPAEERLTGLSEPMGELLARLTRMPYNPSMRLVVLYDGAESGDTRLYVRQPTVLQDVTEEALTSNLWLGERGGAPGARELNTGSVTTLQNFIGWARGTYPGSSHSMLAIVDHGGGWAPDIDGYAQPRGHVRVQAGSWRGMSLDMHSGGSSLGTRNLSQALQGQKVDVLFFDACLMGMIETAYEVRESADFLVAGENVLFAQLPYEDYLAKGGLTGATLPLDLANRIVDRYNGTAGADQNPFTIAAIDLRQLRADVAGNLAVRVNGLAGALLAALPNPATADDPLVQALAQAYAASQKFDYDSSLTLDPHEGYVDLVDFARKLRDSGSPAVTAAIRSAASGVVEAARESATPAVVNLRSVSGALNGQSWSFTGANGLSIFLPLGERDYRPTSVDQQQRAVAERQLTYYLDPSQLSFTHDAPQWAALLLRLEGSVPVIRTGPGGLPSGALAAEVTIDTRRFNTPFPATYLQSVYLPAVRR